MRPSGLVRILVAVVPLAGGLVAVARPAPAGELRGVLRVQGGDVAAASANAYPGRASSMPMARRMPHGLARDAVLWLEGVSAAADTAHSGSRPRLAQKDQCFMPRVVAVAVGSRVDFPNMDPIFHNVFSASPVKRFDLGKYPRGQSRSVTFDKPGIVNVYCDIHSDMEAFVVVLPTRAYARPDDDGGYVLPPVPGGRYTLHVWHPDRPELKREVQVPADGPMVLDLDD